MLSSPLRRCSDAGAWSRRGETMRHGRMARRRGLALGLGGIAGLGAQTLIGGRKAMAQGTPQGTPRGTPDTVVYVSNAGSKEVFVLAMNRATGALELIE